MRYGRIDRHELKRNVLIDWTSLAWRWVAARRRQALAGAVVALLLAVGVVFGVVFYLQERKAERESARQVFEEALSVYQRARGGSDPALAEDAFAAFERVRREHSGSENALLAAFFQARIRRSQERFQEAHDTYGRILLEEDRDGFLAPSALVGMAECQEELLEYPNAIETYQRLLAEYPEDRMAPGALLGIARSLELQNNPRQALERYREVLARYPGSGSARKARERILWLEAVLQEKAS
jgi:TolA-binding protein